MEQRVEATRAAMSMAWQLGCRVVSNRIGEIPESGTPDHANLIQALEEIGRHGSRVGACFAARTGDQPGAELRQLISNLGPGALHVDFDPAELLINRLDVESSMRELAEYVVHFRARDAVRDLSRSDPAEVQLGRGSVDLPPLLALLEEQDYAGFITVQCPASQDARIRLGQSLEYLERVFE
jgi:sugar phosphate isomerase/epimerase